MPACPTSFNDIYLVMEVCDTDMKKLCRTEVHLSQLHVKKLFYNLLVGLHYIHSAGIYHRDLKPANVLVNQDCSVKIADFGLSRAVAGDKIRRCRRQDEAACAPRRYLTSHVVTRWYRAPELILLQDHYDEAIDIWSLGCIFAELLGMLEWTRFKDRLPLFPGACCIPLSPEDSGRSEKCTGRCMGSQSAQSAPRHDQLNTIFNVIGTPAEEEVSRLDSDAQQYLLSFPKRQGKGLRSRVRCTEKEADAMELLERMLRFSPKDRITVREVMRHRTFTAVRDTAKEKSAPGFFVLEFENEADLDIKRLRCYFAKQLLRYNHYSLGGC
jgi:mitogen-activated protein kinase 1/3